MSLAADVRRQLQELEHEMARLETLKLGWEARRQALLEFAGNAAELARRFESLPLPLQRDALRALGLTVRVHRQGRKGKRARIEIELFAPVCVPDSRLAFQGQLHRIDEHDFNLIREALAAAAARAEVAS